MKTSSIPSYHLGVGRTMEVGIMRGFVDKRTASLGIGIYFDAMMVALHKQQEEEIKL